MPVIHRMLTRRLLVFVFPPSLNYFPLPLNTNIMPKFAETNHAC